MHCDKAQEALLAQRYGGTPLPDEVAAHVAMCPTCIAQAQQTTALDRVLALDTDEPPRPGFDTRFFARLEAAKRTAPRSRWRTLWAWGAVATACAVALGLFTLRAQLTSRLQPEDVELALNLDLLQEDLGFMRQLDDVEAYEVLSKLGPEDTLP